MINEIKPFLFILLVTALLFSACAPSTPQPDKPADIPVSTFTQPAPTELPSQPAQPTEAPTQVPVVENATETPAPINHLSTPGNSVYSQFLPLGECNTGFNFNLISFRPPSYCNLWSINLLERPYSANLDVFYPYIDILTAQVGKDPNWIYASLDLFASGTPDDGAAFTYFFEIDLDQNGRGDILLAVTDLQLFPAVWSVTGVRVWQDTNGDVGGPTAVGPDTQSGNGYETLIFDQGIGDDPDLAWARHNPNSSQRIEFAFKPALLNGSPSFMWWAGAMRQDFSSESFDLVDTFLEKDLFEVDTTCGWFFGYEKPYNPKKCYIAPPAPTPTPMPQGCVTRTDQWCNDNADPNGGGFPWTWNAAICKCEPTN